MSYIHRFTAVSAPENHDKLMRMHQLNKNGASKIRLQRPPLAPLLQQQRG
jgi:hypothetical protein